MADPIVTPPSDQGGADLQTELARERSEKADLQRRLEQAEYKLIEKHRESKKLKEGQGESQGQGQEEVDTEMVVARVQEEAKKAIEKVQLDLVSDSIEDEISRMTQDPEEQKTIRAKYDSEIVRGGYTRAQIRADLQKARLLANGPKLEKTLSEMRQTAVAKATQGGAAATGQDLPEISGGNLSDKEELEVARIAQRTGQKLEVVRERLLKNKLQA